MDLSIKIDTDKILGRTYNVEFELGNGRTMSLSIRLVNIDSKYFWFSSEENGLDCIRRDRIVFLSCCDNRNTYKENKGAIV